MFLIVFRKKKFLHKESLQNIKDILRSFKVTYTYLRKYIMYRSQWVSQKEGLLHYDFVMTRIPWKNLFQFFPP